MKNNKYKFSTIKLFQILFVVPIILIASFVIHKGLFIIAMLVFIGGMFNGNADATNFRYDRIIWRRILKGFLLNWFEGKYKKWVMNRWWVHAVFMDGWHFFKNGWVTSLISAIVVGLFTIILLGLIWSIPVFIVACYLWMIGKEMWHHHMSNAGFWGLDDVIEKDLLTEITVGGKLIGEVSPEIFEHLQKMT